MPAEFVVGSVVATILVLVPLPTQLRDRNFATLSLLAWLFLVNIYRGIDAIVWLDDAVVRGPVWCDIVTKLEIAANMAIPGCCLRICTRLDRVASLRPIQEPCQTKFNPERRRLIFDITFCWGLPVLHMLFYCIVQGDRFDIIQGYGCMANMNSTMLSVLLMWVVPLIIVTVNIIYTGVSLLYFFRGKAIFAQYMADVVPAKTMSSYLRLVMLIFIQMIWFFALVLLNIAKLTAKGINPWVSWSYGHSDMSIIFQYPDATISRAEGAWLSAIWWFFTISSIGFGVFLASVDDVVKDYRTLLNWFRRVVLKHDVHESKGDGTALSREQRRNERSHISVNFDYVKRKSALDFDCDPNSSGWDPDRQEGTKEQKLLALLFPGKNAVSASTDKRPLSIHNAHVDLITASDGWPSPPPPAYVRRKPPPIYSGIFSHLGADKV